jgi:hypothetical protein
VPWCCNKLCFDGTQDILISRVAGNDSLSLPSAFFCRCGETATCCHVSTGAVSFWQQGGISRTEQSVQCHRFKESPCLLVSSGLACLPDNAFRFPGSLNARTKRAFSGMWRCSFTMTCEIVLSIVSAAHGFHHGNVNPLGRDERLTLIRGS